MRHPHGPVVVLSEEGQTFFVSATGALRAQGVLHRRLDKVINVAQPSPMAAIKPTKTVFTASQFLDWQRSGVLELNPIFQRRHVWKAPARSQLIDSIARGYPIPIILLRQVQDLQTLKTRMEVVDGQQRLRTVIAYLDHTALSDYKADQDEVVVRRGHNADIAGKDFGALPAHTKQDILGYEFSTHILPASAGDELVFRIFALLNSTGLSLNKQEVRNAEYHGAFKTLVYDLSFQFLDQWRTWNLFGNDAISRMDEAEAVSEYLIAMIDGLGGKSQTKIDRYYDDNDEQLKHSTVLKDRFTKLMNAIDSAIGSELPTSAFRRPALFYSLWVALYDHSYGLKSPLKKRPMKPFPSGLSGKLVQLSDRIAQKRLPDAVQDAIDRATSDPARRRIRHNFLTKSLRLGRQ